MLNPRPETYLIYTLKHTNLIPSYNPSLKQVHFVASYLSDLFIFLKSHKADLL